MQAMPFPAGSHATPGGSSSVRVNALPDAATVLRQLDGWFEDFNENHSHSRLGMGSPRELIRATSPTGAFQSNGGNTTDQPGIASIRLLYRPRP